MLPEINSLFTSSGLDQVADLEEQSLDRSQLQTSSNCAGVFGRTVPCTASFDSQDLRSGRQVVLYDDVVKLLVDALEFALNTPGTRTLR